MSSVDEVFSLSKDLTSTLFSLDNSLKISMYHTDLTPRLEMFVEAEHKITKEGLKYKITKLGGLKITPTFPSNMSDKLTNIHTKIIQYLIQEGFEYDEVKEAYIKKN